MTIYRVENGRATPKPIKTTDDFAEMMTMAPMDLDELEIDLLTLEQEPTPVIHHFAPGIYMREVRLKAGSIALGNRQKFPHLDVMLTGRVTMADGLELVAPMAVTGGAGRKAGVIHEDTVWLNVYATEEQDIGTIEATYLEKSEAALSQEACAACRMTPAVQAAIDDYESMLSDLGVTRDHVALMSAYRDDRIKLPWGAYKFRTAPSPIHGKGVFASAEIEPGEFIGPANIRGHRTVLGYGMNHSGDPNSRMVVCGDGLNVVAIKPIGGNRGGLFGEEITVDYRESRKAALCLAQSL